MSRPENMSSHQPRIFPEAGRLKATHHFEDPLVELNRHISFWQFRPHPEPPGPDVQAPASAKLFATRSSMINEAVASCVDTGMLRGTLRLRFVQQGASFQHS